MSHQNPMILVSAKIIWLGKAFSKIQLMQCHIVVIKKVPTSKTSAYPATFVLYVMILQAWVSNDI